MKIQKRKKKLLSIKFKTTFELSKCIHSKFIANFAKKINRFLLIIL